MTLRLRTQHTVITALVAMALFATAAACATAAAQDLAADEMLLQYVSTPDAVFKWEKGPVREVNEMTISDIVLTSQVWHGAKWQHLLRVFTPAQASYPEWMLLLVSGGSGEPEPGRDMGGGDQLAGSFAAMMRAPVAVLTLVPNQPLFGGLVEDEIISLTFQQYIRDGDPTWPLLFPMTKSAVRAMDALQAYAKQEWSRDITSFVVLGGSKRGWTTWLSAVADPERVKAIAPAVIDTLNFPAQFKYALELWGHYSEEVTDYTDKRLMDVFNDPRGRKVWKAVDPYTFRHDLTLPKLLLLGSNDPYWPTGALNLYWDDLVGPKYVLYAPNSGHGLDDIQRVINTASAFFRTMAAGRDMPNISWEAKQDGSSLVLTITAPAAKDARAWVVQADDLDFRPHKWESTAMTKRDGSFRITVERPADKNIAVFGETDFEADGQPYTLSTQTYIVRK
ncbi:MAG: phenylacetic acid degradation protein [Armatimonadota bacterium]|nr:MAG: phenylacetic acid degradation protein [Armatimonadota bacterium]